MILITILFVLSALSCAELKPMYQYPMQHQYIPPYGYNYPQYSMATPMNYGYNPYFMLPQNMNWQGMKPIPQNAPSVKNEDPLMQPVVINENSPEYGNVVTQPLHTNGNGHNYGQTSYPYYGGNFQTNMPMPDVDVIDAEDLPNFLAKIQGRPIESKPIQPQIPQDLSQILQPQQQTEIKRFDHPTYVSSNTYTDLSPKTVKIVRSFPGDGSEPKVDVISDMDVKQTPTVTIVGNNLNLDGTETKTNNEDNDSVDKNEEDDENNDNDDEDDENAIENDAHPDPVNEWHF